MFSAIFGNAIFCITQDTPPIVVMPLLQSGIYNLRVIPSTTSCLIFYYSIVVFIIVDAGEAEACTGQRQHQGRTCRLGPSPDILGLFEGFPSPQYQSARYTLFLLVDGVTSYQDVRYSHRSRGLLHVHD